MQTYCCFIAEHLLGHFALLTLAMQSATYSTVQLQLHITTSCHACQRVQQAKSSRVPRRDFTWHTSTAKSNIAMCGHAWVLIVQGCNM